MSEIIITSKKEALKILRQKGTKVAIQVGYESTWVFAEKKDYIEQVLNKKDMALHDGMYHDYDGNPTEVYYDEKEKILSHGYNCH